MYGNIIRYQYSKIQSQRENIFINKIKVFKNQLLPSGYRAKHALNLLGSVLEFMTTPDREDRIEMKAGLNQLIENNNQKRKVNSQFRKILEALVPNPYAKS